MTDYLQVSTAVEGREAARSLARSVIAARLAAGAQIVGPVASVVWHLGELIEGEEWQLILKTRADRFGELEAHLVEHHPWKNSEISAVPMVAASRSYLGWIDRITSGDAEG
jgi:periplasmic divalent cation tolerance protein